MITMDQIGGIHAYQTGAPYTDHGQIFLLHGRLFADISRGVYGKLKEVYHVQKAFKEYFHGRYEAVSSTDVTHLLDVKEEAIRRLGQK